MRIIRFILVLCVGVVTIVSCSSSPPSDVDNVCTIFREKKSWYKEALRVRERWGVPEHVLMAIIHQESRFKAQAKPERTKILWVIPWTRPSSAYGYAQVLDETWDWYIDKTGNSGADRDEFDDAADFIGWYADMTHRTLGVSKWDAKHQYLAYHEGHGGYKRRTYLKKSWLVKVSDKVNRRAAAYSAQLAGCKDDLSTGWSLWPF